MGYSYGFGYGHTWRGKRRTVYGGAGLLAGETDGFATDFLYAVDAKRVAVKATNVVTNYGLDSFYQNVGTSPKQVWNVAGVLGWSPHNYCLQSQSFNVGNWSIAGTVSLTVDTIAAPDGTITGDKLTSLVSGASFHSMPSTPLIGVVVGETYTLSVYAKAAEVSWLGLETNNTNTNVSYFDLTNGVVGTRAGIHTASSITAVGNGWYRCSVTYLPSGSANPTIHVASANNVASSAISIGSGVYIWGAQLNRGSVALPYLPTTTAARCGLALDYDPVTHAARGLLCEPAATNLAYYSTDQTAVGWAPPNGSTVLRDVVAPNGLVEGTTITENTATTQHNIVAAGGYRPTLTAATYTFSVFLKAGTRRYVFFGPDNAGGSGFFVTVDTSNWTIVNSGNIGAGWTYASSSIQDVGSGWRRVSVTGAAAANATIIYVGGNSTALGGRSESYLGNGSTIICWGVQIELNAVATSPIQTFAASATRAPDNYSVTPASINHSATAGSWWVQGTFSDTVSSPARVIGYTAATSAPLMYRTASPYLGLFDSTVLVKSIASLGLHKIASAFQAGDRAFTADGLAAVTDAGSTASLLAPGAAVGFGNANGGNLMTGWIAKVRYVPRRKTNAELVTETT